MIQATVRVISNDAKSIGWLATSDSICVGGSTDAGVANLKKQIALDATTVLNSLLGAQAVSEQDVLVIGA